MDKYELDAYGYYKNYSFKEFIEEGCPENIPIGLFKLKIT